MQMTRQTVHQRRIRAERDALEKALTVALQAEYQRVLRALVLHLRIADQHRPQLAKSEFLSPSMWERFRARMRRRILDAFKRGTINLAQIMAAFYQERGIPVHIDTAAAAHALDAQLGLRIVEISDGLRQEVSQKVIAWYTTPGAKLGEIVSDLTSAEEGPFSRARAERVARTEITRLNSLVHTETAHQIGATEWWWSTRNDQTVCRRKTRWMLGPDGQLYTGCRELHGKHFSINAPMPPDSSHPNCRCSPIIVAPDARAAVQPLTSDALHKIEWEENKHPRDRGGEFTAGSGQHAQPKREIVSLPKWHNEKTRAWNSSNKSSAKALIDSARNGNEKPHRYGVNSLVWQGDENDEIRIFKYKDEFYAGYIKDGHRLGETVKGTSAKNAMDVLQSHVNGEHTPDIHRTSADGIVINPDMKRALRHGYQGSDYYRSFVSSSDIKNVRDICKMSVFGSAASDESMENVVELFTHGHAAMSENRRDQKRAIATSLARITGLTEDQCSAMVHQWSETSNNEHIDSLFMQVAVERVLKSPMADWQRKKCEANRIELDKLDSSAHVVHPLSIKSARDAVIKDTVDVMRAKIEQATHLVRSDSREVSMQHKVRAAIVDLGEAWWNDPLFGHELFRETNYVSDDFMDIIKQGVSREANNDHYPFDHETLTNMVSSMVEGRIREDSAIFRGANGPGEPYHKWSLRDTETFIKGMYTNTQDQFRSAGYKPDDEITVFRGVGNHTGRIPEETYGKVVQMRGNSSESWSVSPEVALRFARQGKGVIYMTRVKVRDILSTFTSGFGCMNEGEIVTLNGHMGSVLVIKHGEYNNG